MYLNLDTIKKHLNIDTSFTDDDEYLTTLGEVAEELVESHVDCSLYDLASEDGVLPKSLMHAMLLLVGNLYNNREAATFSTMTEVPLAYQYIIDKYVNYKKRN